MKKKQSIIIPYAGWKKVFLMARITAILLFAGLMQVTASVYSQKTRLNLKLVDVSVESMLKTIEEQSQFYFLYRSDFLRELPNVNLDEKDIGIEDVLNKVIVPYGFNYEIDDRVVVIKKVLKDESLEKPLEQLQQNEVSGKVTDSSGSPLPGVTVVVKGSTRGTVTNADGEYSLANIKKDGTLVFSFVGMKLQEIPIAGKTSIDVKMEEDAIGIEEVVAIGYGTMKKSDLTGSVASVRSEEMQTVKVISPDQALSGRIAGVQVTQQSSAPGGGVSITIRGVIL